MGTRRRRRADRAGRPPMRSPGRPPVGRREHRQRFWNVVGRGSSSEAAGVSAGVSPAVGVRWFCDSGGMAPLSCRAPLSGATCRLPNERRSPCLVSAAVGTPARPAAGPIAVDDLTGVAPQRGHARRPAGLPGHHRPVARRPPGPAPKDRQPRRQRRPAQRRAGPARRGDHGCGWHPGPGPGGALDRAAPPTPQGPALGRRVESGADRSPAPDRLPR
jgi:hypothetical protein